MFSIDWATKRKIIYSAIVFIVVFSFIFYKSYDIIFPAATCNDMKMNGVETGVDCGGACALVCKNETLPIQAGVVKFFVSGENTYDILATFNNPNMYSSPKDFTYKIDIYDISGAKIDSLQNTIAAPTGDIIPVYIKDYKAKNISKVFSSVVDYSMYKSLGATTLKLENFKFENGNIPKLSVTYSSPYKFNLDGNIRVIAILYDALGSVLLAGETSIDGLYVDQKNTFSLAWRLPIEGEITRVLLIPITYNYAE